jgi:hypothetical protein
MKSVSFANVEEKDFVSGIHFETICLFTVKLKIYFGVTDVGENVDQSKL